MEATIQPQSESGAANRIDLLDGWRALSILAVLAGHWLPLGPKSWGLNGVATGSGMALFFTLSGFLITRLLLRDPHAGRFLIRRLFRIVPLAWLAMAILAIAGRVGLDTILANFLFFANLPPARLMVGGEPLWSLCVEVQFYLGVALVVAFLGRRGLLVLPVLALAVTGTRIVAEQTYSIVTWHRVDEILAGATLALVLSARPIEGGGWSPPRWATVAWLFVLFASAHSQAGALAYLRPYFAALAVGCSLLAAPGWMASVWNSRLARYIAETSYALYVVHGMLTVTWLGGLDADKLEKYARRPILIAATFLFAHISTFQYERRWIALGKRVTDLLPRQSTDGGTAIKLVAGLPAKRSGASAPSVEAGDQGSA